MLNLLTTLILCVEPSAQMTFKGRTQIVLSSSFQSEKELLHSPSSGLKFGLAAEYALVKHSWDLILGLELGPRETYHHQGTTTHDSETSGESLFFGLGFHQQRFKLQSGLTYNHLTFERKIDSHGYLVFEEADDDSLGVYLRGDFNVWKRIWLFQILNTTRPTMEGALSQGLRDNMTTEPIHEEINWTTYSIGIALRFP